MMPYLLAYLPSRLAPGSNFYYLVLIFSLEFRFVADARLIDHLVIIMDGTIYFPPVYIKFRRQTARGMEANCKRNESRLEADWKWTFTS